MKDFFRRIDDQVILLYHDRPVLFNILLTVLGIITLLLILGTNPQIQLM